MRIKLTLRQDTEQIITFDYQYYISALIYKILQRGGYNTKDLHDLGFKVSNLNHDVQYKLFVFSNLFISKYSVIQDQLRIENDTISFIFSSPIKEMATAFIEGILKMEKVQIANCTFYRQSIEILPDPKFRSDMIFKTISPIFQREGKNEKGNANFISPIHCFYNKCITRGLVNKYNVLHDTEYTKTDVLQIECIGEPKNKTITIKSGDVRQSTVKAYQFTFNIKGDPELIKISYEAGFGSLNSMGFGMVNYKEITN